MMKWLRANTKQIMVVVVLLAMFSFVGGPALVSILAPDPGKELYARAFGMDISHGEASFARRDLDVLETLFWRPPEYKAMYGEAWQLGRKDLRVEHWFLLAKEAELSGVVVSDQEIEQQMKQLPPETMDIMRTQRGFTPPDIRRALRRQIAIEKNASYVQSAAAPSEAQIRHFVVDTEDKIRVRYIAIPAERFVDEHEFISEDEILAQFEANKEFDPAESETGFGYRYPKRVDLQYLVADLSDISPQVQISMDAVRSYWKTHRSKYTKIVYVDPEPPAQPEPGVDGEPASPSPEVEKPPPQPKQVEKTFSEARPDIERELRRRNATQLAEQAIRKAQNLLARPWQDVRTDSETGFKPVPLGSDDPELMKRVGEQVSEEFGIPIRYGQTGLLSKDAMYTQKDLRGAHLPGGGPEETVAELAFRVPLFLQSDDTREDAGLHLQFFQPPDVPFVGMGSQIVDGRPETAQDRVIIFRVVDAHESEPPADYSEVRDQVERDVRLARAYERAAPTAEELYVVASRVGVERTLDLAPDLKSGSPAIVATTPPAFARRARIDDNRMLDALEAGKPTLVAPSIIGVGSSEHFVDACFEMADPSWEPPTMNIPETGRTAAAAAEPPAEPAPIVRLISLSKVRKHFVVELAGTEPVDQGRYENELRQMAFFRLMGERSTLLRSKWFDPAEIEKRADFERAADPSVPGYDSIMPPARPTPPLFY